MASEALLTADLGNSACKLRLSAPSQATRVAEFAVGPGFSAEVLAWLAGCELDAAFVASVAAAAQEDELCEALEPLCARGLVRNPESGLRIDCDDPGAVGADRLFAARGAFEELGTSLIVADAGTALTVDALVAEGGLARFLGGAIAPGPSLAATALATRAARLPAVEVRPRPPALGRDTQAAIRSGVGWGFLGAARELVRRVSEAAGLEEAPLVVTGGARSFLLPEPPERPFGTRVVHVLEGAVHLGLQCSGREELERTGAGGRASPWSS